ncbi:PoNe immunity protein domain-containing protein [Variovorax paradoxus]|uniref:PoNe immunity protein domain-containing protein n=1 Tax=Variovorax paradoxus TaxID=34073 RepID=UPI001F2242A9|nr:PoNe immunity protein domain-containing protein [Variovorax paradoxus]
MACSSRWSSAWASLGKPLSACCCTQCPTNLWPRPPLLSWRTAPPWSRSFLDGWYKGLKGCYWHDTHTDQEGSSYFGYWAFEAALVTVLWDIDDQSYRDHLVYPKDLADWVRANQTSA